VNSRWTIPEAISYLKLFSIVIDWINLNNSTKTASFCGFSLQLNRTSKVVAPQGGGELSDRAGIAASYVIEFFLSPN
jgi:hypothetical protein